MTHTQATLARLNRNDDERERGFSLIELIIVIVILGILVAIAIPIYNNIQDNAKENALKTAAANGASQVAAKLAESPDMAPADVNLSNLVEGDIKSVTATGTDATDICVTADDGEGGQDPQQSGPGC